MTTKGKILMLHGFVQSDKIFSAKTGGLRKALKKLGYEMFIPCGTHLINKSDLLSRSSERELNYDDKKQQDDDEQSINIAKEFNTVNDDDEKLYGWWIKKNSGPKALLDYTIEQYTLDFLHDYVVENGPFDGILGFSQGAGLAGYLATDFNGILKLSKEEQPPLKFLISFSGFRLDPEMYQESYDKNSIMMPSLHVQGELDSVVSEERVMRLYNSCPEDSRALLKHPGGHFIPNSKPFLNQVSNWIVSVSNLQNTLNGKSNEEEKQKTESEMPDLDDDLMDMIDSIGNL
ncbi:putative serine hydrolase NDAI_0E00820 [Naumovozyma dairenensis CBS 421]|uniref:Serine hydrolase domain-containing protein n=1 Tax=Naumovozyma dairenensis (strain ATCC 10597 / BCRC 20456 / CBS 421 / NBRC 0211 / NRRL Y-12639) TaxID=1071378 RepID=G0WAX8_NAUDC|nr:hypothetical protein NDAI_0E00820 [Naumovozyma dairenensis CBS 421]CCD24898.1 hypothetical protein NDAI_0E00820 [Naumovozyma dairenensis CBS 421]